MTGRDDRRKVRRRGACSSRARACAIRGLIASACILGSAGTPAQDLEPRAYANTPVGLNFLVAGFTLQRRRRRGRPGAPAQGRQPASRNRHARLCAIDRFPGPVRQVRRRRALRRPVGRRAPRWTARAARCCRARRSEVSPVGQFLRRPGAHRERVPGVPAGRDRRRERLRLGPVGPVRSRQARQSRHQPMDLQDRVRRLEGPRRVDAGVCPRGCVLHRQHGLRRRQDTGSGSDLLGAGPRHLRLPIGHLGGSRRHVLQGRPDQRRRCPRT